MRPLPIGHASFATLAVGLIGLILAPTLRAQPETALDREARQVGQRLELQTAIRQCVERTADAKEAIDREKRIAKQSGGYENAAIMHAAAATIVDCEDKTATSYDKYNALGGTHALSALQRPGGDEPSDQERQVLAKMQQVESQRKEERERRMRAEQEKLEQERAGRQNKQAEHTRWAIGCVEDYFERHAQGNRPQRPADAEPFECIARIQLLPDRTVTSVKIEKSCGSAMVDKAAEDGIYRSSPLPRETVADHRDVSIKLRCE